MCDNPTCEWKVELDRALCRERELLSELGRKNRKILELRKRLG